MPIGPASMRELATCHLDLRKLILAAAAGVDRGDLSYAGVHDMMVTSGYRGQAEQDAAVAAGTSKAPWPTSHHNRKPSDAVDVIPYPEKWSSTPKLTALHAYIAGLARGIGIELRGISWDLPHIQRDVP